MISPYGEETQNLMQTTLKREQKGKITISATVGIDMHQKAKQYGISWTEALRRGISIILSEKNDPLYQNPIQQARKIENLSLKIGELLGKIAEYEEQLNKKQVD